MISVLTLLAIFTSTKVAYADLKLFEPDNVKCNESSINYNIVFNHGHHAGRFQKVNDIKDMSSCIGKCCDTSDCDVAFMSRNHCYMVDCNSIESCVTKHLTRPKYETMVSFVFRPNRTRPSLLANEIGEPAVYESVQENASQMDHPLILEVSNKKDKGTKFKQHLPRSRRSEVIDVILAVGASIIAVAAAVIGVITMMKRLVVERGERSHYETIK